MKRILAVFVSIIMAIGLYDVVYAQEGISTLTDSQRQAREEFLDVYLNRMNQIVDLREETEWAENSNENLCNQIRQLFDNKEDGRYKDAAAKVSAAEAKNNELVSKAKELNGTRLEIKQQYNAAVNNNNTVLVSTLTQKYDEAVRQINALKEQIQANKDSVKSLKEDVETYKRMVLERNESIEPLLQQKQALDQKISDQQKIKSDLWQRFQDGIQSKDYDTAGEMLGNIADTEKQLISSLKSKTNLLNSILNSLNSNSYYG